MRTANEKNSIRKGGQEMSFEGISEPSKAKIRVGGRTGGTPIESLDEMGEAARSGPARRSAGFPMRGYTKLSDAANFFHFNFFDKVVLDIGSSTGGFTKYALDHGAKKVIAIEKGTNQMMTPLRFDKRIDLHEKTDIFDFKPSSEINVVVADISFLSLKPVLKHVKLKDADYLVMLKPQFEAKKSQLNKGVVKNERIRREIIKEFERWLKSNDFIIINKHDNYLRGKNGNIERFYYLKLAK